MHTEAQRKLGSSKPECRFFPQSHMCAFMDAFVFFFGFFFFMRKLCQECDSEPSPFAGAQLPSGSVIHVEC